MSLFSYHLIKLPLFSAIKFMLSPINSNEVKGLIHAETMSAMVLGSPVFSTSRLFSREIAVFAQWESEEILTEFLQSNSKGKILSEGYYLKLKFLRQWGNISKFKIPKEETELADEGLPVVAVTLARMKYAEIPRFLKWGRPVEMQVRDDKKTTLSLVSIRYPNLISTFSIWKSQKDMKAMVSGHSKMRQPKRHFNAMKERDRKDFHFEFTTLRFLPVSEHGAWKGSANFLPK